MPTVEATLYHAKWCNHCTFFLPKWHEFAKEVEMKGGKIGKINVVTKDCEEGVIGSEKPVINGKDIRGYPTVKIAVTGNNGKKVEYEYSGKRETEALLSHIENDVLKNLKGSKE